jgi:hypothetical protein
MDKFYMVGEDDAIPKDEGEDTYTEACTTTTPTLHERDYKVMNIGVGDAMILLVDMMTCDPWHVMDDELTLHMLLSYCHVMPCL